MKRAKSVGFFVSLLGTLLLTACVGASPTAPPPTLSDIGSVKTHPPIAMAYDPSDGSLLRADQEGLSRWRSAVGWIEVPVPESSGLSAVVINPEEPSTLYASGLGLGVIRSDDGGASWRKVVTGLPDLDVTALAMHSVQRETLFAWVKGVGIYRTEDGGDSWVRMPDPGPPDTTVRGLTHSNLPGSMKTGWLYAATPTGTYLSMDCF